MNHAYHSGANAYRLGLPRSANPHTGVGGDVTQWDNGWTDASFNFDRLAPGADVAHMQLVAALLDARTALLREGTSRHASTIQKIDDALRAPKGPKQ